MSGWWSIGHLLKGFPAWLAQMPWLVQMLVLALSYMKGILSPCIQPVLSCTVVLSANSCSKGTSSTNAKLLAVLAEKPQSDVRPPIGRGRMQNVHDGSHLSAEKQLELRLRDFLLDIEDRIYQGTLGAIKVFINGRI